MLHSGQFRKVAAIPVASHVNPDDRDLEIHQNLAAAKVRIRERRHWEPRHWEPPIVGEQVEGAIDSTEAASPAR